MPYLDEDLKGEPNSQHPIYPTDEDGNVLDSPPVYRRLKKQVLPTALPVPTPIIAIETPFTRLKKVFFETYHRDPSKTSAMKAFWGTPQDLNPYNWFEQIFIFRLIKNTAKLGTEFIWRGLEESCNLMTENSAASIHQSKNNLIKGYYGLEIVIFQLLRTAFAVIGGIGACITSPIHTCQEIYKTGNDIGGPLVGFIFGLGSAALSLTIATMLTIHAAPMFGITTAAALIAAPALAGLRMFLRAMFTPCSSIKPANKDATLHHDPLLYKTFPRQDITLHDGLEDFSDLLYPRRNEKQDQKRIPAPTGRPIKPLSQRNATHIDQTTGEDAQQQRRYPVQAYRRQ